MKLLRAFIKLIAYIFTPIFNSWENQKGDKFRKSIECHKSTKLFSTALINNTTKVSSNLIIEGNTWIEGEILVFPKGKVQIGEYCFLGRNSKIWSASDIKIGNRVLISHNVNIHDNNSHPINPEDRHDDFYKIITTGFQNIDLNAKPILIEDDVWIGFNATILKGVTIGKGAIIGACTIITEDVPAYTIVTSKLANNYRHIDL